VATIVRGEDARRKIDPRDLPYEDTAEAAPLERIIGQERAAEALALGLEIRAEGFHVFVAGFPGTGRTTAVRNFVERLAHLRPVSRDWCYVYNFRDPQRPKALSLPQGEGRRLAHRLEDVVAFLRRELPRAFEGEDFQNRRKEIVSHFEDERRRLLEGLNRRALMQGFLVQIGPDGLYIVPHRSGEPLSESELSAMGEEERAGLFARRRQVEDDLAQTFREIQQREREMREAIRTLERTIGEHIVQSAFSELFEIYASEAEIIRYLTEVREDVLEHLPLFLKGPEQSLPFLPSEDPLRRYAVNVLVDHSETDGAPVVVERNPTFPNLIGRIEREAVLGVLRTDFTLLRAGSLHRANGGYLILPASDLLRAPFAWDGLKRALRERSVVVEDVGETYGIVTSRSLVPEPIPLDLKVILVGDPYLYFLLYHYDPDFRELFKVKAEFGTTMLYTEDNVRDFVAFLRTLVDKENLLHLEASAVAAVLEYAMRLAEDQEKLSTRFADLADVVREAHAYAARARAERIFREHVVRALEARVYRSALVRDLIHELIAVGTLRVAVSGAEVGVVNGIAVSTVGDLTFGRPQRISVSVSAGREGIFDIEREARLGGRIHTKGVLILAGYLRMTYEREAPLSLAAQIVFEQSYDPIDGDSASLAELVALLSALSGIPARQDFAVTGSVDQKGNVQAVGGVNEKIEGFYDIARTLGWTKTQGVVIPRANLRNLMLREDIVQAIEAGEFSVYAVEDVEEALELLLETPAGARDEAGEFPPDSVHGRVSASLKRFQAMLRGTPPVAAVRPPEAPQEAEAKVPPEPFPRGEGAGS